MQRIPVRSTSVKAVGFEPEGGLLEIVFRNGRVVRYAGVSEVVYKRLLDTPGKALFIEQVIEKSGYNREQVK